MSLNLVRKQATEVAKTRKLGRIGELIKIVRRK